MGCGKSKAFPEALSHEEQTVQDEENHRSHTDGIAVSVADTSSCNIAERAWPEERALCLVRRLRDAKPGLPMPQCCTISLANEPLDLQATFGAQGVCEGAVLEFTSPCDVTTVRVSGINIEESVSSDMSIAEMVAAIKQEYGFDAISISSGGSLVGLISDLSVNDMRCGSIERMEVTVNVKKLIASIRADIARSNKLELKAVPEPTYTEHGGLQDWELRECGICFLPDSFCQLRFQGRLDLSRNQLKALPAGFCLIRVKQTLDLSHNMLQELPEEFGTISVHSTINLSYNCLQALPETICRLYCFGDLILSNNGLEKLPANFGSINVQHSLRLSNNQIRSLPDSFIKLKVGRDIDVSCNLLEHLPDDFHLLNVPGFLCLYFNKLQCLPRGFGALKVGQDLYLNNNLLQQLPSSFTQVSVGGNLDITGNPFSKEVWAYNRDSVSRFTKDFKNVRGRVKAEPTQNT